MSALRQEAIQIVNDIPEDLLSALIDNLRDFKISQKNALTKIVGEKKIVEKIALVNNKNEITDEEFERFLHSNGGVDPKKAAAFARLEEWRKKNTVHLPADTDWKKEYEEALDEKYAEYIIVN